MYLFLTRCHSLSSHMLKHGMNTDVPFLAHRNIPEIALISADVCPQTNELKHSLEASLECKRIGKNL